MDAAESPPSAFDPSRPSVARVYDYLLGGKDNFAADRSLGDRIIASLPAVQDGVRAQRDVLGRVVRYLVTEAGIGQLIDIGSGLPTAENVHETAQRLDPRTRVVYVDNDPVVLAHARALLADNTGTIVIDGDLRNPEAILGHPDMRRHIDWDQPVGLLLCGILHHILDAEHPAELTAALCAALPPGSYVFIHHLLDSGDPAIAGAGRVPAGHGARAVPHAGADTQSVRRAGAGRARPGAGGRVAPRPGHAERGRPAGAAAGLRRRRPQALTVIATGHEPKRRDTW